MVTKWQTRRVVSRSRNSICRLRSDSRHLLLYNGPEIRCALTCDWWPSANAQVRHRDRGGRGRMSILNKIVFAPIVLAVSGCGYLGITPGTGGSGSGWALPWDTSASPSHEIICAYNSEEITSAGTAGPTSGCAHHKNGPSGYTQDGDALDFDLHTGDAVLSVDGGIVRWAGAYSSSSSWSCYGNSISIDTMLPDGSIATALYAHLDSIDVSAGQQVSQGQKIATSGSSGGGTNGAARAPMGPICISRSIRMRTTPR